MARLSFNGNTPVTKKEILAGTAFTQNESRVLDEVILTFQRAAQCEAKVRLVLVGGAATRFHIGPEFKGRVVSHDVSPLQKHLLNATDVDVVVPQIPDALVRKLIERQLVDSHTIRETSSGIRVDLRESPFKVCSFPKESHFDGLDTVDVFHGTIGPVQIKPNDLDFAKTVLIRIDDEEVKRVERSTNIVPVTLADQGLLIATMINTHAATQIRIKRAALMLVSCSNEEATAIGKRYAQVTKRSPLPTEQTSKGTLEKLIQFGGKMHEKVRAFVAAATEELRAT